MSKIILISAKAEHGKDALASILKEELTTYNKKVVIDRFAKYIKMYATQLGWDGKTKDEYWRHFLQTIGTEKIKQELNYKSFHAKRLAEDIQILEDYVDCWLIADTRFPDEIYTLKAMFPHNVVTIRVNRPNHKSKLTEEQLKHESEIALDDFAFDIYVNNNGDIEDLRKIAKQIIERYVYPNVQF